MADSFFYFLPIFLAVQIAKKTNHTVPLFMVIGAMLCYPDIINLLGGAVEGAPMGVIFGMSNTYIFGFIPVISASYTSSVLPILLMTPVMCWAEDFADKVSPNVLKAFLKPMIFLLICTPVAFCVLGPIGNILGNIMSGVFSAMYNFVPWLTVGILSAAMPFIVMTGMHYALIPLCMNNMATLGYDVIVLVTGRSSNVTALWKSHILFVFYQDERIIPFKIAKKKCTGKTFSVLFFVLLSKCTKFEADLTQKHNTNYHEKNYFRKLFDVLLFWSDTSTGIDFQDSKIPCWRQQGMELCQL